VVIVGVLPFAQLVIERTDIAGDAVLIQQLVELLQDLRIDAVLEPLHAETLVPKLPVEALTASR
jgi:ubiquinone biosynthesis protein UbiJ